MIPAYLSKVTEADYYYGTLKYLSDKDMWLIEAEPCVTEMAKRLFPGCGGRGRGEAQFKNAKRINGDLNWLMQRYPLKVEDPERWKQSYEQAVDHVTRQRELLLHPQKVVPPMEFRGELKEFQGEGLGYMLHNNRCLLADEMGLGKTVQALAYIATTRAYPVLLIVPPHLVRNWQKETDRFLRLPQSTGTLFDFNEKSAIHTIKGLRPYELPQASIYIIHYLLLRGWKNILPEYGFKTVIFDEIQELRHTGTEKYSAASLVAEKSDNVIGLSGTPIYNHGGEIWNVINILEYHCLGDWDSFTREWCTGYGSDIVKDPVMLGNYLKREGLMLRRTKKEVLKELPPKRRVIQTIDFNRGVYSELIQSAIQKAQKIDGVTDYFERGRLKRDIVDETRQAIGIAKAPSVAAFVKMLLDAGERVLLFGYHHRVFDIYQEELFDYHPVFITGRQTSQQKDAAVQSFKSGETNICCISLRAAAGIDGLQSGTCVVFGELDWAPAIHSQAEDRIQRIGVNEELDSILCYYLVAEAGTDEAIQEVLGLKVSQFVGIMGDQAETEEDRMLAQTVASQHMDKIVEELKRRAA